MNYTYLIITKYFDSIFFKILYGLIVYVIVKKIFFLEKIHYG